MNAVVFVLARVLPVLALVAGGVTWLFTAQQAGELTRAQAGVASLGGGVLLAVVALGAGSVRRLVKALEDDGPPRLERATGGLGSASSWWTASPALLYAGGAAASFVLLLGVLGVMKDVVLAAPKAPAAATSKPAPEAKPPTETKPAPPVAAAASVNAPTPDAASSK